MALLKRALELLKHGGVDLFLLTARQLIFIQQWARPEELLQPLVKRRAALGVRVRLKRHRPACTASKLGGVSAKRHHIRRGQLTRQHHRDLGTLQRLVFFNQRGDVALPLCEAGFCVAHFWHGFACVCHRLACRDGLRRGHEIRPLPHAFIAVRAACAACAVGVLGFSAVPPGDHALLIRLLAHLRKILIGRGARRGDIQVAGGTGHGNIKQSRRFLSFAPADKLHPLLGGLLKLGAGFHLRKLRSDLSICKRVVLQEFDLAQKRAGFCAVGAGIRMQYRHGVPLQAFRFVGGQQLHTVGFHAHVAGFKAVFQRTRQLKVVQQAIQARPRVLCHLIQQAIQVGSTGDAVTGKDLGADVKDTHDVCKQVRQTLPQTVRAQPAQLRAEVFQTRQAFFRVAFRLP